VKPYFTYVASIINCLSDPPPIEMCSTGNGGSQSSSSWAFDLVDPHLISYLQLFAKPDATTQRSQIRVKNGIKQLNRG
jgi:hypothetical protein